MTEIETLVTLRCIGGPRDGRYETLPYQQEALTVEGEDTKQYRRFALGWGYAGLTFQREVLLWEGLGPEDALVILMRKFVDLLDEHLL